MVSKAATLAVLRVMFDLQGAYVRIYIYIYIYIYVCVCVWGPLFSACSFLRVVVVLTALFIEA